MLKRKYVHNNQTSNDDPAAKVHMIGAENDKKLMVHHVPFKIIFEGLANVDVKFTSNTVSSSGSEVLCNQFRGRPLEGLKLDLPLDYEGFIATNFKKPSGEDDDKEEIKTERFASMTYWNWDKMPSGMDKHIKVFDWMEASQILHAPAVEDV